MLKFYTQYDRRASSLEVPWGEDLVERAGYVPAHVLIENMLLSGQRLGASRGQYEFPDGEEVPDDYGDPTRSPGFDLADIAQADHYLSAVAEVEKKLNAKKNKAKVEAANNENADDARQIPLPEIPVSQKV
nr:MAG: hypothetical protein [Microviridae sp.]